MEVLYGLHPVSEALKAGRRRFDHVLVARERTDDRRDSRIGHLIAQCRDAGIRVLEGPREQLTITAKTATEGEFELPQVPIGVYTLKVAVTTASVVAWPTP